MRVDQLTPRLGRIFWMAELVRPSPTQWVLTASARTTSRAPFCLGARVRHTFSASLPRRIVPSARSSTTTRFCQWCVQLPADGGQKTLGLRSYQDKTQQCVMGAQVQVGIGWSCRSVPEGPVMGPRTC